eukprot:Em0144g14a
MAGTLYTYPDNFRAYKALIAAQYSGARVKLVSEPPEFELGKTNKTDEFLKKFPLGKVPAFETADGTPIVESNAIAYYVANEQLRGKTDLDAALVQQYVNFADNEILPAACTWTFPTLGLLQFNQQATKQAQDTLKSLLGVLNNALATRTFLVGERVTLADISVVCDLLLPYKQVFDAEFRAPFGHMAQFDAEKYNELFPKEKKKEKTEEKEAKKPKETKKPKEAEKPKETKKPKEEEPKDVEEEDDAPKEPKFKDPYADLPNSKFVLDAFKTSVLQ